MSNLITAITLWLAANFGLPTPMEPPRIEQVAPAEIAALRYGALLSAAKDQQAPDTQGSNVIAVYVDGAKTIYLPKTWTGNTPEELSVLVHELVHHAQNSAGLRYACAQEREELAYTAQDRWLKLFGKDLESAFGIDRFTLLVNTRCVY